MQICLCCVVHARKKVTLKRAGHLAFTLAVSFCASKHPFTPATRFKHPEYHNQAVFRMALMKVFHGMGAVRIEQLERGRIEMN
jgi:hypothetical protein